MRLIERIKSEQISLAAIDGPNGGFARRAKESKAAYLRRVAGFSGDPGSSAKIKKIARAIEHGEAFAPPLLLRGHDGKLWVDDGFHRMTAHGYLGRQTIQVTVIDIGGDAADDISQLLFNLEWHGAAPWVALAAIAAENSRKVSHA